MKKYTIVWLILITLSAISALLGDLQQLDRSTALVVLAFLSIKGQLIVDYFMELKGVAWFWRIALSAFCPVLSVAGWFSWSKML